MHIWNNNKAAIQELADAYGKENKSRNRILALAIGISIFLLYASFSIASGKIQADYLLDVRGMGTLATVSLENGSSRQYGQMKALPYLKAVGANGLQPAGKCRGIGAAALCFWTRMPMGKSCVRRIRMWKGNIPKRNMRL